MMKSLGKYPLLAIVWFCITSVSPPRGVPLSPDEKRILDDVYAAYNKNGDDGILDYCSALSDKEQNKVCGVVAKEGWEAASERLSTRRQAQFLRTLQDSGFSESSFPNRKQVRELARTLAKKKYPWLRAIME